MVDLWVEFAELLLAGFYLSVLQKTLKIQLVSRSERCAAVSWTDHSVVLSTYSSEGEGLSVCDELTEKFIALDISDEGHDHIVTKVKVRDQTVSL